MTHAQWGARITQGHWTPLSILATDCRFIKTSWPALSIANLFWLHELNAWLTKNVMALPQTVGFKAEAVDEERVWCVCTVDEVDNDCVIVSFEGWNAQTPLEWGLQNYTLCLCWSCHAFSSSHVLVTLKFMYICTVVILIWSRLC